MPYRTFYSDYNQTKIVASFAFKCLIMTQIRSKDVPQKVSLYKRKRLKKISINHTGKRSSVGK